MRRSNPHRHSGAGGAGTRNPSLYEPCLDSGFDAARRPGMTAFLWAGKKPRKQLIFWALTLPSLALASCHTPHTDVDANRSPLTARADRELFSSASNESICVNGTTYQGCCSGKGGVKNIRGRRLLCNSGELSPSCKGDITSRLKGCCSHNEGIDYVTADGNVICSNESESRSCKIYLSKCA